MVRAFKIFQRSMKNFRSVKMTLETRTHFEIYRRNPKYVQQTLHGICYTVLHVPIILQISLGFLAYFSILNMVPKLPNRFIPRAIDSGYKVLSLIFGSHACGSWIFESKNSP